MIKKTWLILISISVLAAYGLFELKKQQLLPNLGPLQMSEVETYESDAVKLTQIRMYRKYAPFLRFKTHIIEFESSKIDISIRDWRQSPTFVHEADNNNLLFMDYHKMYWLDIWAAGIDFSATPIEIKP